MNLVNTELKNAVSTAAQKSQYDAHAKRLLGNKNIPAHILVKTVDEFKDMHPKEIIPLIEGTPYVGSVPLDAGLTNRSQQKPLKNARQQAELKNPKSCERLIGFNTENGEINEGLIRFDIVFYVRTKNGLSQIIINVEAQKDAPKHYPILNRAVFYGSRLISSQKERDFEKANYQDIKQVYSIWICMNMQTNSLSHIHLIRDDLIGSYDWDGRLDLLNIIMIGLTNEPPKHDEFYDLHRLLCALLSQELSTDEKLNIIGTEYGIPVETDLKEDINIMCNLSEYIEEKGIAKGIASIILKLHHNGLAIDQIASMTDKSIEEIRAIIINGENQL